VLNQSLESLLQTILVIAALYNDLVHLRFTW